jgi:hypothetical protein
MDILLGATGGLPPHPQALAMMNLNQMVEATHFQGQQQQHPSASPMSSSSFDNENDDSNNNYNDDNDSSNRIASDAPMPMMLLEGIMKDECQRERKEGTTMNAQDVDQ